MHGKGNWQNESLCTGWVKTNPKSLKVFSFDVYLVNFVALSEYIDFTYAPLFEKTYFLLMYLPFLLKLPALVSHENYEKHFMKILVQEKL